MAAWLAPALKAVLPHLGTIVSAVAPVFTRKRAESANQMQLLQDQIAELQTAASNNAGNIKDLATQLQTALTALEQTAAMAESKITRALWLSAAAILISAISITVTVILLFF